MHKDSDLLKSVFADLDGKKMPYEQTFYPPRPLWEPLDQGKVLSLWQARAKVAPQPFSRIYIHFPFCEKICRFCGFNAVKLRDEAQMDEYLSALIKEMRLVSARTRGMRFNQVCMGGGTPSLLTPAQFRRLFAALYDCFDIDKNDKMSGIEIECHPDTLTDEKIKAMAECGITHVALGIQSMEAKVLALNGRVQDSRRLHGIYKSLQASGIPNIAAEMMCGLNGQTEAGYLKDIATIIKWQPCRIFMFDYQPCDKLHDPSYTKQRGLDVHKMWNDATELIKAAGYHVHGHFATRGHGGRSWPDSFDNTMTGESIIGLGTGAISHLFGKCRYQNTASVGEYLAKTAAGELPVASGALLSARDNMRYLLLDSFSSVSGRLDPAEFLEVFGRRPESVFRREFDYLLKHKILAKIDGAYCVCDQENGPFELHRCFYGKKVIAALKAKFAAAGRSRVFQSVNPRVDSRAREEGYFAPVNLTGEGDRDKLFVRALSALAGRGQKRLAMIVDERSLPKAGLYAGAAMKGLVKAAWLIYSSDKPAKAGAVPGVGRFERFYAVFAGKDLEAFLKAWEPEYARLKALGLETGLVFAAHKGNVGQLKAAFDWAGRKRLADLLLLQPCLKDAALLRRVGGAANVLPVEEVARAAGALAPAPGAPSLTANHLPLCSPGLARLRKLFATQRVLDICSDKKIKSSGCLNCPGGDACEGVDVSYSRRFELSDELFREDVLGSN